MILTTPSGYVVEYREYLTFGQKRSIDQVYRSRLKMKMSQGAESEMTAEATMIAEDMAIDFLVSKITKGDQVITANFRQEMEQWKEADGQTVLDAINQVTSSKKKAVTTS